MGEVYRARDTRLGRDIALKLLPSEVAMHPDRLARFEREARTVAALNHPNIVMIHSIEAEGGMRFLTMELVEGQSLDHVVAAGGLSLPAVLDLAIPLADALVAAHERGIVHRDLKPGNVMVTRDGRVKVLDFGLAKLVQEDVDDKATQVKTLDAPISKLGQVVGTVPYMAPEQIRGEPVDARSDLFSLGVLMYELASGKRPFAGATSADVTSAILRDMPAHLAPVDLDRIVTRCLEKNPRERYQSALDVMNDLRALRREQPFGPANVRTTAQQVGGNADGHLCRRNRDRPRPSEHRLEILRRNTQENTQRILRLPNARFQGRDLRLSTVQERGRLGGVEFRDCPALKLRVRNIKAALLDGHVLSGHRQLSL